MADVTAVVAQATSSSAWVDAPLSSSVSESDAARLANLLSMQAAPAPAPTPASPIVSGPSSVQSVGSTGSTLGDSILRTMNDASRLYQQKTASIDKAFAGDAGTLTPMALLGLQRQMLEVGVTVDVIAKGVGQAARAVDQISKLQ